MDADSDRRGSDLQLLRSSWQIAAILQFCRAFAHELRFKPFSADSLESAVLHPYSHQYFLSELVFKLLRNDVSAPFTEKDGEIWENMLHKKLRSHWRDAFDENPLENRSFFEISPLSRLHVLYYLCEWRAHECPVAREFMKEIEGTDHSSGQLQELPIGEDAKGNRYWYFSYNNEDCRLYRENQPKSKKGKKAKIFIDTEPEWDTVCTTLEDLEDFVDKLGASRNRNEKQLHSVLSEDILPALIETANARRKAEEKAAMLEAMPRKRSSRIQEVMKKKEEEDKKRHEEEEERRRIEMERDRERKEREREMRALSRHELAPPLTREERLAVREQKRVLTELVQDGSEHTDDQNLTSSEHTSEPVVEEQPQRQTWGWSPLGPPVYKRPRTTTTRPTTNLASLVSAVEKWVEWDYQPLALGQPDYKATEQRTPRARQVTEENIYAKPRHSFRNRSAQKTKDLNSDFGEGTGRVTDPTPGASARDQPSASQGYNHRHPLQRMKQLSKEDYTAGPREPQYPDEQAVAQQSMQQAILQQQRHNQLSKLPSDNQAQSQHSQKALQQQHLGKLFNMLTPQQKAVLKQLPDNQKRMAYLIQCTGQHQQHLPHTTAAPLLQHQMLQKPVLQPTSQSVEGTTLQAQQLPLNQQILSRLSVEQRQKVAALPPHQQTQFLMQLQQRQMQQQQQLRAAQLQQQAELMQMQGQSHQNMLAQHQAMQSSHLAGVQQNQINLQYHSNLGSQGTSSGSGMPQVQNNHRAYGHSVSSMQQNASNSTGQTSMHAMSHLQNVSSLSHMSSVDRVQNGLYGFAAGNSDGVVSHNIASRASPNLSQRTSPAIVPTAMYNQNTAAPLFGVSNPMRSLHAVHTMSAVPSNQLLSGQNAGTSSAMLADWLHSNNTNGMTSSTTMHSHQ